MLPKNAKMDSCKFMAETNRSIYTDVPFPQNEIYAINPKWLLHEDGNKVLFYKVSLDEVKYLILPPLVGIIAPLFDGKRTLREVAMLTGMILGESDQDQCLKACLESLKFVNHDEVKIIPLRLIDVPIVHYKLEDYVVNLNAYQFSRKLNRPFRALVLLSNRCCTDCVYCYAERPVCNEMSREEWNKIIEEMRELKIHIIDISGGDPLARKDSITLLQDFIRNKLLFLVSTKCPVSDNDAEALVEAGFLEPVFGVYRKFQLSLDAADPNIAAQLTRTPGYLQRVQKSVKSLLQAGIVPQIKAVMTPYNYHQAEPLIEMFAPQGIKHFTFSQYSKSCFRHDDSFFMSDSHKKTLAKTCEAIEKKYPEIELTGDAVRYESPPQTPEKRKEKWLSRAGCSGGFVSIGIAPDGKVILCEQAPQKPPFVVGTLRRQSIMEVWNSGAVEDFLHPDKELFADTICHECKEFETCHYQKGWCYRDAYAAFGTPYAPTPDCPYLEDPPRMR